MAGSDRQTPDPLIEELQREPYRFDFYGAGRLLQRNAGALPRIGHSWSPKQDPVRFAQKPAMDFAPATLQAMEAGKAGRPPVLFMRHFGLFGPHGPLPLCLTEYAHDRASHHGDPTFVNFCNVFHHRLASFLFRAWADTQKVVDFDRPSDQRWNYYVGALAGLGLESSHDRDSLPDRAKLYFAGRLAQQTANAEGLQAIVQEFFQLPTELISFVGRWLDLPPDSRCRLGASKQTGLLGVNAIAGSRFWTRQLHFCLRLGPMSRRDYERMLPDGTSFPKLRDWVRLYVGDQYSWDVQLVLRREEVPCARLGQGSKLGLNSWLTTEPFSRDPVTTFAGRS